MQLNEVKIRFETGDLKFCEVFRTPLEQNSWSIQFFSASSRNQDLETQRGEIRQFKTLDAAFSVVSEIGFKKAIVHL